MRSLGGQVLRIGVASDSVAVVDTRGWPRRRVTVVGERSFAPEEGFDSVARELKEVLDSCPTVARVVVMVVADEIGRIWTVTPPPGSRCMADLQAAAGLRFESLFGAPISGWKLSADWSAVHPFLAAAVPLALLDQLELATRGSRMRLVEIVPHFVAALNRWRRERKPGAWFGLVHGSVLTMAVPQGARPVAVRTAPVPPDADACWLHQHVWREALLLGLAPPDHLQLAGRTPAAWSGACGTLSCSLLEPTRDEALSPAVHLACTGYAP